MSLGEADRSQPAVVSTALALVRLQDSELDQKPEDSLKKANKTSPTAQAALALVVSTSLPLLARTAK